MGLIYANELKRKVNILVDNQPYTVMDVAFATPSARGTSTLVKVKLRNLLNGAVQDKSFKTDERFNEPDVAKVPVSFLYSDPENYHFMDEANFEQFSLSISSLDDVKFYIKEGLEGLQALRYNGAVVSIELPPVVELTVTSAEPAVKGASASGRSTKKAQLETGLEVLVPLYVEPGTVVRVNTQTGEVSGRA